MQGRLLFGDSCSAIMAGSCHTADPAAEVDTPLHSGVVLAGSRLHFEVHRNHLAFDRDGSLQRCEGHAHSLEEPFVVGVAVHNHRSPGWRDLAGPLETGLVGSLTLGLLRADHLEVSWTADQHIEGSHSLETVRMKVSAADGANTHRIDRLEGGLCPTVLRSASRH